MNSLPLSERIARGRPWVADSVVRCRMTACAPIERDTQLPSERRVNSSTTLRMRIGPERRVAALTKSYDQVWLTASAGRLRDEFSPLPWARLPDLRRGGRRGPPRRPSPPARLRVPPPPPLGRSGPNAPYPPPG